MVINLTSLVRTLDVTSLTHCLQVASTSDRMLSLIYDKGVFEYQKEITKELYTTITLSDKESIRINKSALSLLLELLDRQITNKERGTKLGVCQDKQIPIHIFDHYCIGMFIIITTSYREHISCAYPDILKIADTLDGVKPGHLLRLPRTDLQHLLQGRLNDYTTSK